MTEPLISIQHVTKRFGGVIALDDVSFDVAPGAFHAIVGENGAGKSTLMKILTGVLTEYEGEILLRGQPLKLTGTRDAEAAGISIIHQELNLVDELSAAANMFLGREIRGRLGLLDDRAMRRKAGELFKELECEIRPATPVRELRVGDQQLVEIAKALSINSDVLIMDEPTSALTESEVERLFRVIGRLRERGVTILYISHKMDEVFRLSEAVTVLRDGKHVATLSRDEATPKQVTHLMVGREIEQTQIGNDRTAGDVVLKVEGLSLPYPPGHARKWRLKDIHFELRRGEVLGIAGLMGAGRTELLESLFGVTGEKPAGKITARREGGSVPPSARSGGGGIRPRHRRPQAARAVSADGRSRQHHRLHAARRSDGRDLVITCRTSVTPRSRSKMLGVRTDGTEAGILSLSGGNQQKCVIARWLRTRPRVLLLDDPTRGIDVGREGRDLPRDRRALQAGDRHHRHEQRAARVADAVRPHSRAVRRSPDRRIPTRRVQRTRHHGSRDRPAARTHSVRIAVP